MKLINLLKKMKSKFDINQRIQKEHMKQEIQSKMIEKEESGN